MFENKTIEEIVAGMIQLMVNRPEEVKVEKTVDDIGTLLMVTVHPLDMGFVIGKAGSIVNALRVVIKAMGYAFNEKVNLKLHDPRPPRPGAPSVL